MIRTLLIFTLLLMVIYIYNCNKSNNSTSIELFIDNNYKNKELSKNNEIKNINKVFVNKLDKSNNINNNSKKKSEDSCNIKKCSLDKCGTNNIFPILDPNFNMREVAKQCLLLEDHLNNKSKRCFDCIRKHFLIIDGLLEEAISLDKNISNREIYYKRYLEWINLQKKYSINSKDNDNLHNISMKVRLFRKPLVEEYFDTISDYP